MPNDLRDRLDPCYILLELSQRFDNNVQRKEHIHDNEDSHVSFSLLHNELWIIGIRLSTVNEKRDVNRIMEETDHVCTIDQVDPEAEPSAFLGVNNDVLEASFLLFFTLFLVVLTDEVASFITNDILAVHFLLLLSFVSFFECNDQVVSCMFHFINVTSECFPVLSSELFVHLFLFSRSLFNW